MPRVAVIGAGTMGHGIAELFAIAGYEVHLTDILQEILDKALKSIEESLKKVKERGLLKEDVSAVLSRIKPFVNDVCRAVGGVEIMVEAVVEDIEVKKRVFAEADRCAPPEAVLATNTSSLPITEIAEAVRPDRRPKVVGMHFFNPPVLMPLVEIVKGKYTNDETVKKVVDYTKKLGKEPVVVNKDVPGFIVNRILARVNDSACWLVARGLATPEAVDAVAMYKVGLPMGVFLLLDFVGIDVACFVAEAMGKRGFGGGLCPVIAEKCQQKKYGVKTGEGFYKYPAPGKFTRPNIPKELSDKLNPVVLFAPAVNEAAYLLRDGVATREDIDKAVKLGLNWPKGPLELADEMGIDTVVKALEEWTSIGFKELAPDPLLLQLAKEGKLGRKTGEGFYKYAKSVVTAVTETLEKLYGEPIKQLESLITATGVPVYRDPKSGALLWVDVREMRLRFTLSVNKLEKFVEGLQRGRLMYTQCRRCGAKYFPPQVDCPKCKTSDVEWRETSTEGELITWTVINVKPGSFSHHSDYVVGIVKMPDGFNITAWIDADPKALKPGMKVRLVVDRRPGENYITYWFKPA